MKSASSEINRVGILAAKGARQCSMLMLIGALSATGGITLAHAADSTTAANADVAVAAGRLRFEKSCAICHGVDAKGDGPFAQLLNIKPPDLSHLTPAQGGSFPFSRIYQRIDGRDLPPAHGTPGMPIWGMRLKREGGEETYVRGRIFEIMLYLESIQQP